MPSGVVSARAPFMACLLLSPWGRNPWFGATPRLEGPFSPHSERPTVITARRRWRPISGTPSSPGILTAAMRDTEPAR